MMMTTKTDRLIIFELKIDWQLKLCAIDNNHHLAYNGSILFFKAGSVLRMIKNFVSEPVWKKALEKYLNNM